MLKRIKKKICFLKQVVRKITTYKSLTEPTSIPLRECFMELFKNYSIPNCEQFSTAENLELCLNQLLQAAVTARTVKLSSAVLNYYGASGNGENGENVEKQNKTNRKKQQVVVLYRFKGSTIL